MSFLVSEDDKLALLRATAEAVARGRPLSQAYETSHEAPPVNVGMGVSGLLL
jgi:hypothetical protein